MTGYTFTVDHVEYIAHPDGAPLTLVDCILETQHVGVSSVRRHGVPILRRGINLTEIRVRGEWKIRPW